MSYQNILQIFLKFGNMFFVLEHQGNQWSLGIQYKVSVPSLDCLEKLKKKKLLLENFIIILSTYLNLEKHP